MSKYVRYTCNKKNEPTMREDCKNCPEYNPCGKEGRWCFIGALVAEAENNKACADVVMPLTENLVSPVLRDMSTVTINFGNGQSADMLREEIEFMGPVKIRDVEEAQQKVVNVIRNLEDKGEIVISRGQGDEMIV